MNKDLLNILANSNKDIDNQQLMDYLSGKLSGEDLHELERSMAGDEFLNDAVEGLQQVKNPRNMQAYVEELNAAMQKSLEKKKTRRQRLRSRIKDEPWTYVAIILVLALCIVAYVVIRQIQHK
jgi:anti-sigma factor RsiW